MGGNRTYANHYIESMRRIQLRYNPRHEYVGIQGRWNGWHRIPIKKMKKFLITFLVLFLPLSASAATVNYLVVGGGGGGGYGYNHSGGGGAAGGIAQSGSGGGGGAGATTSVAAQAGVAGGLYGGGGGGGWIFIQYDNLLGSTATEALSTTGGNGGNGGNGCGCG